MWQIIATGPRALVEAGALSLDNLDPSPAEAVSAFETKRGHWRLEAISEDEAAARQVVQALDQSVPSLGAHASPLEDANWIAMSLEGLPRVDAGRFVVAGAHALPGRRTGRIAVRVEAGEAFGTGHHGTTRGCLLALEHLLRRRSTSLVRDHRVLDLGTGSGVLAIAAARAGYGRVEAYDIDPKSVRVTQENVALNEVGSRVFAIGVSNGLKGLKMRQRRYEIVFANILMRPLVRLSADLAHALLPGGRLIVSGLLVNQEPFVQNAYTGHGLILERRSRLEGWSTLVFRKPG
jgi:ribosomal protein L11 methyltransferase